MMRRQSSEIVDGCLRKDVLDIQRLFSDVMWMLKVNSKQLMTYLHIVRTTRRNHQRRLKGFEKINAYTRQIVIQRAQ